MPGHMQTIGTRAQVWHGNAKHTSGGLIKSDLMQNRAGRIVSKKKHGTAKREMRLVKYGYGTKKGEFGFVKIGSKSRRHKRGKHRGGQTPADAGPMMNGTQFGGSGMGSINPANVNSNYMIKDVVPQHFGPFERALLGGRSRSRGRSRGRGRSIGRSQHGGAPYGNAFSPSELSDNGMQAPVN
jgi:hypothetical protein